MRDQLHLHMSFMWLHNKLQIDFTHTDIPFKRFGILRTNFLPGNESTTFLAIIRKLISDSSNSNSDSVKISVKIEFSFKTKSKYFLEARKSVGKK